MVEAKIVDKGVPVDTKLKQRAKAVTQIGMSKNLGKAKAIHTLPKPVKKI